MERNVSEYIAQCEWGEASFLIFSDNVFGNFIYYSHLLPLIASVGFATFILFKNPKLLASRWLFITTLLLAFWLFADLILWATEKPTYTFFFWALINMVEPMIYAGMIFFMYALVDGKDISFKKKLLIFSLLLPTVLLTPTRLALVEYDLSNCWREAIEGPLAYYGYVIEAIFSLWILGFGFKRFIQRKNSERTKVLMATLGSVFFLVSFAMGNVVGSLLVDWETGQHGLFAIPVFVAVLAYMIIRYNAFNVKVLSAQLLVSAIWVLTLAILFVRELTTVRIIVFITLILFTFLGYYLIQSVRREVESRERIEKLATELRYANNQQTTLIHFITHQVKGFFTKSRNIFAGLAEGDFGPVPKELEGVIHEGFVNDTKAVDTVQDILKAANIRKGTLTYENKPLDLSVLIQTEAEKFAKVATNKGVELVKNIQSGVTLTGDQEQLSHAVRNLIDNSLKYTQKGSITLSLAEENGKIRFSVKDTGVGISQKDMKKLFTEGGKGENSTKVNVDSTGYGLYIVRKIIEAHKGKVWAESEGEDKGSEFVVEFPAK